MMSYGVLTAYFQNAPAIGGEGSACDGSDEALSAL